MFFFRWRCLRRELWWRNLVLVISMVLFGVWHKATLLFVLWGCYQGMLLVVHRQVQQMQRRFDWNPPEAMWNLAGWVATTASVSLGWILFRANSSAQASQMRSSIGLSGELFRLMLWT